MPSIKQQVSAPLKRQRNDFSVLVKEMLAKRSGYLCSNPTCRTPTRGPRDNPLRSYDIGVAAQICTVLAGGPRYDGALTSGQLFAITNGLWLCNSCAERIDIEPGLYPPSVLRHWRENSERQTADPLYRPPVSLERAMLPWAERYMPKLLIQMREDLAKRPQCRVFTLRREATAARGWKSNVFIYYKDEHKDLDTKIALLQNYYLVHSIAGKHRHYLISEELLYYCQL